MKLGHVAVDGTKLQANASKHKAMSYGRMRGAEETLKAEVEELLKRAGAVDAVEDEKQRQGLTDPLPKELARRESRLKKIRQARAELEGGSPAEGGEGEGGRGSADGPAAEARGANGEEDGWRPTAGSRSEAGGAGCEGAAQLHRSGQPDHARRRAQRQFRAGLQCPDRCGR